MNVLVFDLGGTLMEYRGMALSWEAYYRDAFVYVRDILRIDISESDIDRSCRVLAGYNPRLQYREIEIAPEKIFVDVTSHWRTDIGVQTVIAAFFDGLKLSPVIYDDTIEVLGQLKARGNKLAMLTDLPTGMPDEILVRGIEPVIGMFDLYVSSLTCGYRKPNKFGLAYIAEHFNVAVDTLLFIGDEEKDVKAAHNAGCRSGLIDRRGHARREHGQDFTIRSLSELLDILCVV